MTCKPLRTYKARGYVTAASWWRDTTRLDHATAACTPGRAAHIRDGEAILIDLVRNAPPAHVRITCRRIADLVDDDGTTTPPQPEPDNTDGDGDPRPRRGPTAAPAAAVELLKEAEVTAVLQPGPWRSVAVGRTHRVLPDWLRPSWP